MLHPSFMLAGLALALTGLLPPATPEIRLVVADRLDGAASDTEFRVDADQYVFMWSRGSVVVRAFPLGTDHEVDLELSAFDPVTRDARFEVVRDGRSEALPVPAMRFFRGRVAGEADSTAYLWMHDGVVGGFVRVGDSAFGASGTHVFGPTAPFGAGSGLGKGPSIGVSRSRPLPETWSCAAQGAASIGVRPWESFGASRESGATLRARVAIDTTARYRMRFLSDQMATAYAMSLIGAVSAVYQRDLSTTLEMSFFRLHVGDSPYSDEAFDPVTLLNEVRNEWTTDPSLQAIPRAAVQLFHSPLALGGVAEVDTLCDDSLAYSVSYIQADHTDPLVGFSYDLYVVSHEFGHNFGSDHTHCYVPPIDHCGNYPGCYEGPIEQMPGTVMSYCDEIEYRFHERVVDFIAPRIDVATCLEPIGPAGEIAADAGAGLRLSKGLLPTSLINDDGSPDEVLAVGGTIRVAWVKRFTLPCAPFRLTRVDVMIHDTRVQPGRPLEMLVYSDPSASGEPANATLVHTQPQAVQTVSSVAWNEYPLTAPQSLPSGELYVGFYDLDADPQATYLASKDDSRTGDAYRAFDSTDPTDFSPEHGETWLIRAVGTCDTPTLILDWGEPCNALSVPDQDFGVYRGTLEPPFDDHLPETCTTQRERTLALPSVPSGDVYFVVVPSTGEGEGSYGTLAPSTAPCRPPNVGVCD